MPSPSPTAERILDAALRRFNEQGYDATTLHQIADDVGIRQGNLTYHFATKHDLVLALRERLMSMIEARHAAPQPPSVADHYVERLVFIQRLNADFRSLIRDRMRFDDAPEAPGPTPEMSASLDELRSLLGRAHDEGLFRQDVDVDLDTLATSIYVLGRYWPDHLREMEGRIEVTRAELLRGGEHHFAILLPYLTAAGRRTFTDALERALA